MSWFSFYRCSHSSCLQNKRKHFISEKDYKWRELFGINVMVNLRRRLLLPCILDIIRLDSQQESKLPRNRESPPRQYYRLLVFLALDKGTLFNHKRMYLSDVEMGIQNNVPFLWT